MTGRVKLAGRGWAYVGAALGGAVSIAANVAHSYVPPSGAVSGWAPQPGAVIGAIFWPVFLFIAIEILARYAWPAGYRWVAVRYLGLLPVAVVAAVVSYRHLSGLLHFYGEDGLTVAIGPLAVDGLMVMATGALIAAGTCRIVAETVVTQPTRAQTSQAPGLVDGVASPAAAVEPSPATAIPAGSVSDLALDTGVGPDKAPAARKARTATPKRQPSAADRVARAAARSPKATPAQLAARLNLSERTVQRYMPKPDDSVSTPALKVA
jgi:hypothetical protein